MPDTSIALSFFSSELRQARLRRSMTQEQLAHQIHYSASLIAMLETGRRSPKRDLIKQLDEFFETDGLFARIYEDLLLKDTTPGWFQPWRELEAEATSLRSYHPGLIHGLLQTPDYMRAVLRADTALSEDEVEARVAARLERQARVLGRDNPPMFIAVIDEAVLRRPIGGPQVMYEQCRHLIALARRPRTLIQVIPLSVGMHPGLDGPFVIAGFDGAPDAVYLDGQRGRVVEHPEVVSKVKQAWETLRAEALPREQSIHLISEVAESWNS